MMERWERWYVFLLVALVGLVVAMLLISHQLDTARTRIDALESSVEALRPAQPYSTGFGEPTE